MSKNMIPLGLVCSDIHLSHKPPIARSVEPSWRDAMLRPLKQLKELQKENDGCPIFYAGDIFDKPSQPIDFVNWCIDALPKGYAIPGQHDLPNHRYDDLHKSVYWTLVKAGVLRNIRPEQQLTFAPRTPTKFKLRVIGVPYGHPIPSQAECDTSETMLLAHKYIWKRGTKIIPGSKQEDKALRLQEALPYVLMAFGDNHSGFVYKNVLNCGAFIRRAIDEEYYRTCVGLVRWDDGILSFGRIPLDTSEDKFLLREEVDTEEEMTELQELIDVLDHIEQDSLDFRNVIKAMVDQLSTRGRVKEIILSSLERGE